MELTCELCSYLTSLEDENSSLITLWMPPKDKIDRVIDLLGQDQNLAKTHEQRHSLQFAKSYIRKYIDKIPDNGLVCFCGSTAKFKLSLALEPTTRLNNSLYLLDSKFHLGSKEVSMLETFNE